MNFQKWLFLLLGACCFFVFFNVALLPISAGGPDGWQPVACKGTFTEVTTQEVVIRCDDGRAFKFSTYKDSFARKPL